MSGTAKLGESLTNDELRAAQAAGMSAAEYEALKGVRTHDDYLAAMDRVEAHENAARVKGAT